MIVFMLRMMKETALVGDIIQWLFRLLVPSFNLCDYFVYLITSTDQRVRRSFIIKDYSGLIKPLT